MPASRPRASRSTIARRGQVRGNGRTLIGLLHHVAGIVLGPAPDSRAFFVNNLLAVRNAGEDALTGRRASVLTALVIVVVAGITAPARAAGSTKVSIVMDKWHLNGKVTYPGAKVEGLLMNVRMV